MSSPSRGTWIEMLVQSHVSYICPCRPPHGGRGLKCFRKSSLNHQIMSSPSRGTWIEMLKKQAEPGARSSRPPHGGRGLKLVVSSMVHLPTMSSPSRGTWIEIRLPQMQHQRSMVVPLTGDVD